ncbi:FAD-dependent oxidoreductase [Clostridium sp. CS001]|uniref:FAD-dependent oxidoreductase n=1 Tax=Clostridium sp. CS001 TaxID=2880648 RepID=UPI001CF27D92|nr:FAD-dependent oxidoreductase [Clostridium sp. CS001]MCB2290616.1 FAD-dependent oxidoreductase [Clostridium sp. CS001]
MNKADYKVAIIGGGLAGLVMAYSLQKKGYKDVTVFEKDDRVGGKLNTIWYKGKSYEFGAIFGLPCQKQLKKLLKTFNIKVDGPKLSRENYDATGNKVRQIPKDDLSDFVEELSRLPNVLKEYKSLESFNIHNIEAPLMLPFSTWCDINQFKVLKTVYGHHFTSYGLGDIDEVPALYVLRVLNYDNIMSFMELPELSTWKEGVSSLIECLNQEIKDIRLGQRVTKVSLSDNEKLCIHTDFEVLEFHRVVVTAPLNQFANIYGEDPEMKQFLSCIKYEDYKIYAFIAEKLPKGCGCVLENLSMKNRGHIIIWNSRWYLGHGEDLVMVYAYDNPERSVAESLKIIESDLLKLGIQSPRLYQVKHWKQGPHVDTNALQNGFYEKMEAMQGKNNIFLAGEIMSTVSMENCIKYSNYLMDKYF